MIDPQQGFIKIIIILLIAVLLLSYFGIDLREAASTPLFKKNIQFTWETIKGAWTNYIYHPLKNLFSKQSEEPLEEVVVE